MGTGSTGVVPVLMILLSLIVIAHSGCPPGFFSCESGTCIKETGHCDGHTDCSDGSDEQNCEKLDCRPPFYFICDNQRCIESLLKCDGEDDCADWSDEKGCEDKHVVERPCTSEEFKCSDNSCIPADWVCDQKEDCIGGLDETEGCVKTVYCLDGFLCANHHCIAKKFHCDGKDDCGDESDESSCMKLPPISMKLCTLNRGLFACHDGKTCLSIDDVCDGTNNCLDGSDEGPMCLKSKAECPKYGCSYKCVPTPVKPLCICPPGFTIDEEQKYCKDDNECNTFGICSQKCKNTRGSYYCSCDEGYVLQKDNYTCKAEGGDAALIFSTRTEVRAYFMSSDRYFSIAQDQEHISGVEFDGSYIYWTSVHDGEEAIVRSKRDGSDVEILVTSGLSLPEDLAIDWATGNIYFTDGEGSFIGVCSKLGKECTALVNANVAKPRGIALLVAKGQMFWSDWGSNSMIATSGMDGSNPKPFVQNVEWPNGITLDLPNERLYWVDSKTQTIESVRLDASDRRVVLDGVVKHPYSIALFEDQLYWSDWEGKQILSCHKFNGKSHKTLIRLRKNNVYGIKVYHEALRPKVLNPCNSAQCSDLCLLAPNNSYTCACPPSKVIGIDQHTCTTVTKRQMIMAASRNEIIEVEHQILGRQFYALMAPSQIKMINAIVYNSIDDLLIISDGEQKIIFTMDINTLSLKTLIKSGISRIGGLDFDYLGNNLYWCDVDKYSIEVYSFNTLSRKIIYRNTGDEIPFSIAVVPEEGLVYVAFVGGSNNINPHIDAIVMDGSGIIHVTEKGLEGPVISLWYDYELHRIFWSDSGSREIRSIAADGTDYRIFRSLSESPMALTSLGQDIFWTTWESNYLYWSNKYFGDAKVKRVLLDVGERLEVMKLTALKEVRSVPDHECHNNNAGCSHLCLLQRRKTACGCPDNMILGKDGKTCLLPPHCAQDEIYCPADIMCIKVELSCNGIKDCPSGEDEANCNKCKKHQFQCHNGHCIDVDFMCDGIPQCSDGSDEAFCENCTRDQFKCKSGHCINKAWHCDGTDDCSDASDEIDCFNVTCNSGEFRCKSGACIPLNWKCDNDINCADSSDEEDCSRPTCRPSEFTCHNGVCIDVQLICDGDDNCGDNSDEKHCQNTAKETVTCKDGEFRCASNQITCISESQKCNGNADCPKGEDEIGCGCDPHEFECRNGKCITSDWVCDGSEDCHDMSDEDPKMCSPSSKVASCDGYVCQNGQCLQLQKLCNGHRDCEDGSDEGGKCEVACSDNPCEGICQATPLGYRCSCGEGFTLLGDGRSCGDVNECKDGVCSQICLNTHGSFKCHCLPEYTLRLDRKSCKAEGPPPEYLYVTQSGQIRKVSKGLNVIDLVYKHQFLKITGMDVDTRRAEVYWTMQMQSSIHRKSLKTGNITYVDNIGRPSEISVDWVTQNIYFIDNANDKHFIKACNLEEKLCALVAFAEEGSEITQLIVDPLSGYLFWAETSLFFDKPKTKLYRAELSGVEQTSLVDSQIAYVSGLAIDSVKRILYWADKVKHTVGSITYDGKDQRIIFTGQVNRPTGLTFFEDSLYWLTADTGLVTKCQVFGRSKPCQTIHLNVHDADHFTILQRNRHIDGMNLCDKNGCTHLCVLGPHGPRCICSDGKVVEMGIICKYRDTISPKFSPPVEVKSAEQSKSRFIVAVVISSLVVLFIVGYFLYKKYYVSKGKLDIRIRFQNPAFGFPERPTCSPHMKAIVPGDHEYVNPLQTNDNVNDVAALPIDTCIKGKKKIKAPSPPLEDESDSDFSVDQAFDMKTRLIP